MQVVIAWIKSNILNKSFLLGLLVAVGLFSHYIFGHDNLFEELSEKFIHKHTGADIDFTPSSEEGEDNSSVESLFFFSNEYEAK